MRAQGGRRPARCRLPSAGTARCPVPRLYLQPCSARARAVGSQGGAPARPPEVRVRARVGGLEERAPAARVRSRFAPTIPSRSFRCGCSCCRTARRLECIGAEQRAQLAGRACWGGSCRLGCATRMPPRICGASKAVLAAIDSERPLSRLRHTSRLYGMRSPDRILQAGRRIRVRRLRSSAAAAQKLL